MKKQVRKLRLHRETLHRLGSPELRDVQGAASQVQCTENSWCYLCATYDFTVCFSMCQENC